MSIGKSGSLTAVTQTLADFRVPMCSCATFLDSSTPNSLQPPPRPSRFHLTPPPPPPPPPLPPHLPSPPPLHPKPPHLASPPLLQPNHAHLVSPPPRPPRFHPPLPP